MSQINRIRATIQAAIASKAVTKASLAYEAEVPQTTLIGMERAEWNPSADTLAKLEVALDNLIRRQAKAKSRPKQRRGALQPAA